MGQAKKRGNREQRIAQAHKRERRPCSAPIDRADVLAFCAAVDGQAAPMTVGCAPVAGPQGHCFDLVEQQVEQLGGRLVLGWAIWEVEDVMLEAELHAVWLAPDGRHVDIAPRPDALTAITFLPDSKGLGYARQVDNIRHPLSADPRVLRFIALAAQRFAVLNEGGLADQFGAIALPAYTLRKLDAIHREMAEIKRSINQAR